MALDTLLQAGSLLLAASLKGSALILLVAIVQWIGREKIPAGWRYAMWLLVIARLLLPAAPESRFSLFNLASPASGTSTIGFDRSIPTGTIPPPVRRTVRRETVRASDPLPFALVGLWAMGALLLAGRSARASLRLARQLRAATRPRDRRIEATIAGCAAELRIRRKVPVLETDAVGSPALHGIVRPKLLVPRDLLSSFSEDELRYIVLHELAHLRRADVLVNVLAAAVECLHWFNPLVWIALARMREERELACDRAALTRLRPAERSDYGRTMLKLLDCFRTPAFSPAIVGMASRQDEMKRRILMIAAFRKSSRASLAFAGVVALLGFASLTDAQTVKHRVMKMQMEPEAKAIFDRLSEPLTAEYTEANVLDIVQSIAGKAGITVAVATDAAPELASAPKVSLKVERMPSHVALLQTLSSVDLGLKFNSTGIEITKADASPHVRVLGRHGAEGGDVMMFHRKIAAEGDADVDGAHGEGPVRHIVVEKLDAAAAGGEATKSERRILLVHPEGETAGAAPRVRVLSGDEAKIEIKVHKQ